MADLRTKITENSRQFLHPGEKVDAVIGGQTSSIWWIFVFWIAFYLKNNFRAVLVTDQRIVVLDCGRFQMTKPKSLVRELPRITRIGPASGLWWKSQTLGETLYINRRFHKDIAAADAAIPAP